MGVEPYTLYLHSFYTCGSEIELIQQVLLFTLHMAVLTCAWLLDSGSSWITLTIDLDLSALNSGLVWGFFLPVSFSSGIFNSDQLSPLGSEES